MYLTFEESSDIALYHKYLTNEEFLQKYPFVKHKIEHLFPMLKEQLCNLQGDSTIVIADFIGALEKKHHTQIIDILEREKINFLDEENTITDIFINTMEYTTSTLQEYTVFFSLFPFSTFWDKEARISLLQELWGFPYPSYKNTCIHEVSHSILWNILSEHNISCSPIIFDVLKECLAPIIIRNTQSNAESFFTNANPEFHFLYLSHQGVNIRLVDHIENLYLLGKKQWIAFIDTMQQCITLLSAFETDLLQKKKLFNQLYHWEYMRDSTFINTLQQSSYPKVLSSARK